MFNNFLELGEKPYNEADAEWDEFVAAHPHGSILQTTNWARLKSRFGWTSYRVWVRDEGKLIAGAQILFKSAAFRMVKMGYIPHGPLVDWDNKDAVEALMSQLDWAIYEHRAGILKFEPFLLQGDGAVEHWQAASQQYDLRTDTDTIQPPRTMLIDIAPTEEEVLASFRSKTRYNIRLSAKKGITVREGTAEDIPTFNQMLQVTGERNEFGVHSADYYRAAYELFSEKGDVALILAEFEGKPLAGALIFKNGKKADYIAGASNNEERNRMPTYAVQWAAIKWAKSKGCTVYDMWGLPDADADELEAQFKERSDGLWGVYRFKRGFNGTVVRTVGTADKVYNNLVYKLYRRRRNLD